MARLLADGMGISLALVFAYAIKFKVAQVSLMVLNRQIGQVYAHAQFEPYVQLGGIVMMLFIILMVGNNGYSTKLGMMPMVDELIRVVKAMVLAMIVAVFMNVFVPFFPPSRFVLGYVLVGSVTIVWLFRCAILMIQMAALKQGIGSTRTLIIGAGPDGQDIGERMVQYPMMGYQLIGFVDDAMPEKIHYHLKDSFRLIGGLDQLDRLCVEHEIGAVFFSNRFSAGVTKGFFKTEKMAGVQVNMVADPYMNTLFLKTVAFDGLPLLRVMKPKRLVVQLALKRVLDTCIALVGLVITSPIIAVVAVWIRCVSPGGSIIYIQDRVGQHGHVFGMIKFRSMIPNAESDGQPVMVNESGDSRYIRGGQFLRQYSIDELPQLWNVVKGDMSLVGPRPERPYFVTKFGKQMPHFFDRHMVPVGITGWAQVNGRSVLTRRPEQKIKYDLYYIYHWSLLLDVKILLKTIGTVIRKEESY